MCRAADSLLFGGGVGFSPAHTGGVPRFGNLPMIQSTDGGPMFLATTWHGGSNNAATNYAGRVLASPGSAVFHHDVRVRRFGDGIEAWFFEDSYPVEVEGRWSNVNLPTPKWQRLTHPAICAALLAQAESEQSHPAHIP